MMHNSGLAFTLNIPTHQQPMKPTINLDSKPPRQEFNITGEVVGVKTCMRQRSSGMEIWQRDALSFHKACKC